MQKFNNQRTFKLTKTIDSKSIIQVIASHNIKNGNYIYFYFI